jgi:hypothetical protein
MSNIQHIENNEGGLSVREKLNAVIDRANAPLWEEDVGQDTISPVNGKKVDAANLTGEISGGPFHP